MEAASEAEDCRALGGVLRRFARDHADTKFSELAFCQVAGPDILLTAASGPAGVQLCEDHAFIWRIPAELAEAFAEMMHELVRRQYWGYAHNEHLTSEELIKEAYQGIRPAPGYPACPDHTEKTTLFELLKAEENAGMNLTESLAMTPAAAVSGFYFAHPQARYFGLGKISKDQVEDYAVRKNMPLEDVERWLGPNINY